MFNFIKNLFPKNNCEHLFEYDKKARLDDSKNIKWSCVACGKLFTGQEVSNYITTKYDKPPEQSKWKRIDQKNKPTEVVILTFDSIDCGWTMDIGWWNEKDQTWTVNSEPVSYPYSHFQELPKEPPESEGSDWRKEDNK